MMRKSLFAESGLKPASLVSLGTVVAPLLSWVLWSVADGALPALPVYIATLVIAIGGAIVAWGLLGRHHSSNEPGVDARAAALQAVTLAFGFSLTAGVVLPLAPQLSEQAYFYDWVPLIDPWLPDWVGDAPAPLQSVAVEVLRSLYVLIALAVAQEILVRGVLRRLLGSLPRVVVAGITSILASLFYGPAFVAYLPLSIAIGMSQSLESSTTRRIHTRLAAEVPTVIVLSIVVALATGTDVGLYLPMQSVLVVSIVAMITLRLRRQVA